MSSITDETFVGPWRAPKTPRAACGCTEDHNGYDGWCDGHRPRKWAERTGWRWWVPEDVAAHKTKEVSKLIAEMNSLRNRADALIGPIHKILKELR